MKMDSELAAAAHAVPSPCYLIDLGILEANARKLNAVQQATGCRVLLALKGFAMFCTFPLLRRYLTGACASSVHEARLAREEFGGEVHAYSPAFTSKDIEGLLPLIDHITFNSISQWTTFAPVFGKRAPGVRTGLRVNPEHSEVKVPLYDPCAPGSRLGIQARELAVSGSAVLEGISGLHIHTLCELGADALERTAAVFEKRFSEFLTRDGITWVNLGGGHHITRDDYDVDRLCRVVDRFRKHYGVEVYLEPGEAIALDAGYLVATVLDIIDNDGAIAILDTSATAHMPDVLEMPYRPTLLGADLAEGGEDGYRYRLGGNTCLAGDVIGEYVFPSPLAVGQRLVFTDMAHYTMVKNTTFNGVPLPAIATFRQGNGAPRVVREFGYSDYRDRLS